MCGRDIEKSICREMSGNVEDGMVAVGMLSGSLYTLLTNLKVFLNTVVKFKSSSYLLLTKTFCCFPCVILFSFSEMYQEHPWILCRETPQSYAGLSAG